MFQKVETASAQSGTGKEHGKHEVWEEESPIKSSGTRLVRDMDGKTSTKSHRTLEEMSAEPRNNGKARNDFKPS